MTVYVADWAHREPVFRVIGQWMKGIHYCSTGVNVAGLAHSEWVVEIDAIAVDSDDD
jgi:enamine deaminase RidA (YjgF/YER057c/UK114 family)